MRRFTTLALMLLFTASTAPAYEAVEYASGLQGALLVTAPPGDMNRVFILEQAGRVRIVKDDLLLGTPFLDITAIISTGGERGLLGLAFHPQYPDSGYFYLNHTSTDCASSECTKIVRYRVDPNDPDLALPGSREEILEIAQPWGNHNGGCLVFGPDGYLYIGMGDGGSGGDPQNNAQNGQSMLGKMLRIDIDGAAPYEVPDDNPFVGEDTLDEIWATGLRNPWRFSFDRQTGDLWIGDVGQELWEEIDHQPALSNGGENYGWRLMEGEHCYNPPVNCNDGSLVLPVHEYANSGGDCSVTGGHVHRGGIPDLQGRYLFADYCSGKVWAYDPGMDSATLILTDQNLGSISSFGEDALGHSYICTWSRIWRIEEDPTDAPPPAEQGLRLAPPSPNPFHGLTEIRLSLEDQAAYLELAVYAVDGRRLRLLYSGAAHGGELALSWDGRNEAGRRLPAGVYLLQARSGGASAGRRITLLH